MKEKLKTLKDFEEVECGDYLPHRCEGREFLKEQLREEAKKWIKELNKTLEKACEKQTDGYYNDAELEIEGVTYTASAFEDDGAKPIIKFIHQFFNLEEKNDMDSSRFNYIRTRKRIHNE